MVVVAAMAREATFIPPPPPSPPPVVVEAGPDQGADSKETHEVQVVNDLSLWLSFDWTTPPVTNPRELLLNIFVDRRESHLDRTFMHLYRASTVLADYKLLLNDYEASLAQNRSVLEENESLKGRLNRTESLEAELGEPRRKIKGWPRNWRIARMTAAGRGMLGTLLRPNWKRKRRRLLKLWRGPLLLRSGSGVWKRPVGRLRNVQSWPRSVISACYRK